MSEERGLTVLRGLLFSRETLMLAADNDLLAAWARLCLECITRNSQSFTLSRTHVMNIAGKGTDRSARRLLMRLCEESPIRITQDADGMLSVTVPDSVEDAWDFRWLRRAEAARVRSQLSARRESVFSDLIDRDGDGCGYCGSTESLQIDHIRPVSKGGGNELENLQILCRSCNVQKSDADHTDRWGLDA